MGVAPTKIIAWTAGITDARNDGWQLSQDVEQWLLTHVGTRGEQWGATIWNAFCWEFTFRDPAHAVLFKLTWC
jgi:hypothetical protein